MTETATRTQAPNAMTPVPYRVRSRTPENADSVTLRLDPVADALGLPLPGQFMMLYAFGVGEIAASLGAIPSDGSIIHTIRAVGAVSAALCAVQPGSTIGVRGPFGTHWGLDGAVGNDLVIVAGGVGLAPLRPVVEAALAQRDRYGRVVLIAGARTEPDFLYAAELAGWERDPAVEVHRTVDIPIQGWPGETGFVTEPLRRLSLRRERTSAFLCGPELMMRNCAKTLLHKGITPRDIRVSLERNMQCGVGWCGHCQLGPVLLCRDGPVVGYDVAQPLLDVEEL